jgi:hypothetical protein
MIFVREKVPALSLFFLNLIFNVKSRVSMDPSRVRGSGRSGLRNSGILELWDSGMFGGDRVYKKKGRGPKPTLFSSNGSTNIDINIKCN